MKKINILLIAIALLAITLPVMGQVTLSGEFKGGLYLSQDPGTKLGQAAAVGTEAKLSASIKADDNVTGTLDMLFDKAVTASGAGLLDKASIVINMLGAMGIKDLPLTMTLTSGYVDANRAQVVDISHHGLEKMLDAVGLPKTFGTTTLDTKILDMVTVRAAVAPEYNVDLIKFLVGAFGTFGPVSVEAFYGNGSVKDGAIAAGVAYAGTFGDITVKAGGNLQLKFTDPDLTVGYGAAASVAFTTLVKATVGFKGQVVGSNTDSAFQGIGIGVESTPISLVTLKAGVTLSFVKDSEVFDGIEVLGQLNLGKASLGVGYNFANATTLKNDAFLYKAATGTEWGGVIIQTKMNF